MHNRQCTRSVLRQKNAPGYGDGSARKVRVGLRRANEHGRVRSGAFRVRLYGMQSQHQGLQRVLAVAAAAKSETGAPSSALTGPASIPRAWVG